MKTELFAPVLAWLEAGAPHNDLGLVFNMDNFQAEGDLDWSKNHCGTACCIAGALAQFNQIKVDSYDAVGKCYELGRLIGMTEDQVDNLFLGEIPEGREYYLDEIPPQVAAQVLSVFLETGYAPWPERLA